MRRSLSSCFGCDADAAQDGAGEFGKEALDEIEPRAVIGGESEFEAVRGLTGEPGSGLFGDMRGMSLATDDFSQCLLPDIVDLLFPDALRVLHGRLPTQGADAWQR